MEFNLALLKEHPYATGGVVIVGALVVFYLLSSGNTAATTTGTTDNTTALDEQLAQVQAAAQVQTNAQTVQQQQNELTAQTTQYQTDASVKVAEDQTAASTATTLAQVQAEYNLGLDTNQTTVDTSQMQADVLEQEIAAGERENDQAFTLANTAQTNFETNVDAILPLAGKQYNSALDANNANAEFLSILSNGSPAVSVAGVGSSSTVAGTSSAQQASTNKTIASGLSSIITGLFG